MRKRLTEQQQQCVVMLASALSTVEAAEALGVTPRTVRNWRALPAFQAQLEAVQAEVEEHAAQRMRALGPWALEQLVRMAADPATGATARERILSRFVEQSGLRPQDLAKAVEDMDRADVVKLASELPPDVLREALRLVEAA